MTSKYNSEQLHKKLGTMSISTGSTVSKRVPAKEPVVDSWEDEDVSSSDSEADGNTTPKRGRSPSEMDNPSAPPPTPASPTGKYPPTESLSFANPYASLQPSRERQQAPDKRPEKTTGPAARMIAGALGVRAPKRTEEEREYDKAVREQEKRRKEKLKMEEAAKAGEAKKAKQSYWDD